MDTLLQDVEETVSAHPGAMILLVQGGHYEMSHQIMTLPVFSNPQCIALRENMMPQPAK